MQYTEILQLIAKTKSKDEIGNIVAIETKNKIYAKKNKVGTKEFYNAVAVGITPTAELQIKGINYNGEEECEYNGKRYAIIRTIPATQTDIILVIGLKQGIKDGAGLISSI